MQIGQLGQGAVAAIRIQRFDWSLPEIPPLRALPTAGVYVKSGKKEALLQIRNRSRSDSELILNLPIRALEFTISVIIRGSQPAVQAFAF
jgi:hypothetical protein